MVRARPLVTLHFAQSLDGRIGFGPERERALLSGAEGFSSAHRARGRSDAVLVGVRTLIYDDPLLTARNGERRQPLRVVLDSELRSPPSARLFGFGDHAGPVLVFGSRDRAAPERRAALERVGARVHLTPPDGAGRVCLREVLEVLASRGVERLLVEGGACVITSFLQARLAARVELEVAPWLLGAPATPAVQELGVVGLGQALRLDRMEVEPLGQSLLVCGNVVYPEQSSA
jgi:5-amino-6-(5-phosphoribosylamino)uracil reductase/diaminohydroxyphosphoribosylaminopyrimidine deaminase/5-amino-6-(5-phosphoribosylamino)uracil reductase